MDTTHHASGAGGDVAPVTLGTFIPAGADRYFGLLLTVQVVG